MAADIWSLDGFEDKVFFGAEDGLDVTRGGGPLRPGSLHSFSLALLRPTQDQRDRAGQSR